MRCHWSLVPRYWLDPEWLKNTDGTDKSHPAIYLSIKVKSCDPETTTSSCGWCKQSHPQPNWMNHSLDSIHIKGYEWITTCMGGFLKHSVIFGVYRMLTVLRLNRRLNAQLCSIVVNWSSSWRNNILFCGKIWRWLQTHQLAQWHLYSKKKKSFYLLTGKHYICLNGAPDLSPPDSSLLSLEV